MQLCWCSESNRQAIGRAFCQKTHFSDKTTCDVNSFMRLTQKFTSHCSGLRKTLPDANRELRSYHVSVWRSCNRTASQHMWTWGCWAFPRTWGWALCTETVMSRKDATCRGWGVRLEHTAVEHIPEALLRSWRNFLFEFCYFSVFWSLWVFSLQSYCKYRGHLRAVKNTLWDSVLPRANLHGCWLCRYQSKHEVTRNTCLPSSVAETWDIKESS